MVSDGRDAAQASAFVAMPLAAARFERHWDDSYNRNGCAAITVSLL